MVETLRIIAIDIGEQSFTIKLIILSSQAAQDLSKLNSLEKG
jgi:hypothetical protein